MGKKNRWRLQWLTTIKTVIIPFYSKGNRFKEARRSAWSHTDSSPSSKSWASPHTGSPHSFCQPGRRERDSSCRPEAPGLLCPITPNPDILAYAVYSQGSYSLHLLSTYSQLHLMLRALHSSHRHWLSICYVPGTDLGTGCRAANKADKFPVLVELTSLWGEMQWTGESIYNVNFSDKCYGKNNPGWCKSLG